MSLAPSLVLAVAVSVCKFLYSIIGRQAGPEAQAKQGPEATKQCNIAQENEGQVRMKVKQCSESKHMKVGGQNE